MCLPALPLIAIAATVASAAVGAYGQIQAGKAARSQGEYENAIAQANAKLAAGQANDAKERGQEEAKKLARQQAQLKGRQVAAMGANGVDLGFGSPLDVQFDTAMIGAEDLGTSYTNTAREMKGYDISSANYRAQGKAAQMRGKAAQTNSYFQAGSTILGGVAQVAGMAGKFGSPK